MSAGPFLKNERLEQNRLKRKYLATVVTLNGNTTPANITASTDMPGGVDVYLTQAAALAADAGSNIPSLQQTTAPAVIAILTRSGDLRAAVATRVTVISSATMTGGVATRYGTSSTGVSALGNGAITISCTALDLDAANATHTFLLEQWFDQA